MNTVTFENDSTQYSNSKYYEEGSFIRMAKERSLIPNPNEENKLLNKTQIKD